MKNNTKLIMETWRRFLKEDILDDEPPEGYFDDKNNPKGFNPDDEGLDNPIDGEPPFDHAEPPEEDGIMADDDYDEVVEPSENDYDELPYTQKDARTSDDDYAMTSDDDDDDIFDLRYGSRFGSNDELDDNPFGEDDGPY